jgi:inorganic triphosphatase YgiF
VKEHLETERKYEAGPDFVMPGLAGLDGVAAVAGPDVQHLAATYFDTADLRLVNRKITLRRRTGGADAGWHLKVPEREGTRRELHEPLGPGDETVPLQLAALVADITGDMPLGPVARLETERTVRRLTDSSGTVLAEVADDLVTGWRTSEQGSGASPDTWREVEVELVSGSPDLLDAVGAWLVESGARPSRSASKLARVLQHQ